MDINLGLSIISTVSFMILLWIFNRFFFGPILNNVRDREKSIENQLKEASNAYSAAAADRNKAELALSQTREEAVKILDKARELAEKSRHEILNRASVEASDILSAAQVKIEMESRRAFDELKSEVAAISLQTAEKILTRTITDADHLRLVNEVINERSTVRAH